MTLKRYKRHRKPTGPAARVSIADVRGTSFESSAALAGAEGARDGEQPVDAVLRMARLVGPGIQLDSPGFLTNRRQHGMFGLAALEVGQLAKKHWDSIRSGGAGAVVPDAGSSAWRSQTTTAQDYRWGTEVYGGGVPGHPVGYRDIFDVAVRWRQLSEPNDPVWWIDRLTPEAFREGFGLQTPMVNGQLKVRDRFDPLGWMRPSVALPRTFWVSTGEGDGGRGKGGRGKGEGGEGDAISGVISYVSRVVVLSEHPRNVGLRWRVRERCHGHVCRRGVQASWRRLRRFLLESTGIPETIFDTLCSHLNPDKHGTD